MTTKETGLPGLPESDITSQAGDNEVDKKSVSGEDAIIPFDVKSPGAFCIWLPPPGDIPTTGYQAKGSLHVDIQMRDRPRVVAFYRLREALIRDHARLLSGKPVHSNADVFRWLVENIHGAYFPADKDSESDHSGVNDDTEQP